MLKWLMLLQLTQIVTILSQPLCRMTNTIVIDYNYFEVIIYLKVGITY